MRSPPLSPARSDGVQRNNATDANIRFAYPPPGGVTPLFAPRSHPGCVPKGAFPATQWDMSFREGQADIGFEKPQDIGNLANILKGGAGAGLEGKIALQRCEHFSF